MVWYNVLSDLPNMWHCQIFLKYMSQTSEYTHLCLHFVRNTGSTGLQTIVYLHKSLKISIQLHSQINLQYSYKKWGWRYEALWMFLAISSIDMKYSATNYIGIITGMLHTWYYQINTKL